MDTFGAIDIGSNAMRLAVARLSPDGSYKILATHREPVRLGHDVFKLHRITPPLMERAVTAFLNFERLLRKYRVKFVRAVGTSALRDAANSSLFIERVERATGIKLEVISGDEEARLIQRAVGSIMSIRAGTKLLIDIGGGSVELTLLHRGSGVFADSVPLGTVRLLEMLRGRKRPTLVLQRLIRQYASGVRRQVRRCIGLEKITCAIGTGGNLETLGDLRKQFLGESSDNLIRRDELQKLLTILQSKSVTERIEDLHLRPDRADVIVPATALLIGILRESGVSTLRIPKVGLREGILVDLFERKTTQPQGKRGPRETSILVASALQLGRRFEFDERHAKHVAKLSLGLFDRLQSLHKLGQNSRVALEIASLLHDIGYYIDSSDHHKHSSYIISNSDLVGLGAAERDMIAAIARYHTGSLPSIEHPEWRRLDAAKRTQSKILAGILRIAEELDKEHLRRVSKITIRRTKTAIILHLSGKGPLLVERWGAERRKHLLEKALRKSIEIT
jgi:exopolyphosphatase/guanosine-5'-triphosphate,3'-diphosphate pyrophosphatase